MRRNKASSSGTRGFTLIELLVVVAIIGLLSSVILASLNGARVKGRDARRLADVKQIQLALELYYDDSGNKYPPRSTGNFVANIVGLTPTYISVLPHDPNKEAGAPGDYQYWTNAANRKKGYSIRVHIERISGWCRVTVGDVTPNDTWKNSPDCSTVLDSEPPAVG